MAPGEQLEGRAAIVTGGSRGIGLAVGAALVAAGANVILTSRSQDAADSAARSLGERAIGFGGHVAEESSARACVELALERFGRLDVLVNNAGTNPAYGRLVDVGQESFLKTFDVNLWAPVLWTGVAWERWMEEHGGSVLNMSSIGAFTVDPGLGAYNATKAALVHTTRHLAVELSPRVRVNAIAPGIVRTRLSEALWLGQEDSVVAGTPAGRLGEPGDVGAAAVFLASDAASWVTGETLVIDGGQGTRTEVSAMAGRS